MSWYTYTHMNPETGETFGRNTPITTDQKANLAGQKWSAEVQSQMEYSGMNWGGGQSMGKGGDIDL